MRRSRPDPRTLADARAHAQAKRTEAGLPAVDPRDATYERYWQPQQAPPPAWPYLVERRAGETWTLWRGYHAEAEAKAEREALIDWGADAGTVRVRQRDEPT